jgi:hypothetical protein
MVRTVLVFSLVADDVGNFLHNQRFEHRQQIKQNQQVIFIKLRSAPELDLMPPMEANLLIMIVRIVRSIASKRLSKICSHENQSFINLGARLRAILADRLQQSGCYNQSFSF